MKNLALKVCRFVNNSYICSAKTYKDRHCSFRSFIERTYDILTSNRLYVSLGGFQGYALSFCTNINLKCS